MKLGLVQYNPEWENKQANQLKIVSILKSSIVTPDLLIFPEMTLTGYTMNTKLSEVFDLTRSETLQFFQN